MLRTISLFTLLVAVAGAAWVVHPVDTAGTVPRGWWTSMRVSGEDVHIAYARHTNTSPQQTTIGYALSTDLGESWTVETVDTSSNYGTGYALLGWHRGGLDLEADGTPQIAYTVESGFGTYCMLARRAGPGTWDLDTVERRTNQPYIYHDADLKIGADTRTRVVYTYQGAGVRFARSDTDGWFRRDMALGNYYGVGLELDSADNPHVVHARYTDTRYAYSSNGGTSWTYEVVDSSSFWHVDIDLDDESRPYVAYIRANEHTRFARRDGSNDWTTFYVYMGGPNCCRPSIYCTPGSDNINACFYPYMALPAVYRAVTTDRGASWNDEQVALTGGVYASYSCPDFVEDSEGRYVAFQSPDRKLSFAIDANTGVAGSPGEPVERVRVSPTLCRARALIRLAQPAREVSLHDASGRLVRTIHGRGRTELHLDVTDLGPGAYLVRAGAAQGRLLVTP